jgi:hypothetical protein
MDSLGDAYTAIMIRTVDIPKGSKYSANVQPVPEGLPAFGAIFIFVARHGAQKPGEELPPEFVGWIFAVIGSLLFLLGIAIAICILIAGRSLETHSLLVRIRYRLHR